MRLYRSLENKRVRWWYGKDHLFVLPYPKRIFLCVFHYCIISCVDLLFVLHYFCPKLLGFADIVIYGLNCYKHSWHLLRIFSWSYSSTDSCIFYHPIVPCLTLFKPPAK